jgi:hypothetical protein
MYKCSQTKYVEKSCKIHKLWEREKVSAGVSKQGKGMHLQVDSNDVDTLIFIIINYRSLSTVIT